jgi:eukaryotic-like serine/threonine-protein kinase
MTSLGQADAAELLREALMEDRPDDEPKYIDGYEILEEIAQGGMGVVYKARCLRSGLLVALKMIRPALFLDDDALQLFRHEIQATVAVQHTHVVPVMYVGEHEGQLYYTMMLCKGSLASGGTDLRTPDRVASVIEQVARGVECAHRLGFLHLDLKPANVLIDKNDIPRVADFGLARFVSAEAISPERPQDSALVPSPFVSWSGSRSIVGVGTPPYTSPEQASRKGPLTSASDVYSIGAILFELLTGQPPSATSVALHGAWPSIARPLERDLLAIARKCMEPDPKNRYRSAAELADDVGRARRHEPTHARPLRARDRWLNLFLRRPKLAASLFFLVCLLPVTAAAGVWIVTSWTRDQVDNVLLANGLAAKFAAGWVLTELTEKMADVERIATDPRIAALAAGPPIHDARVLQAYQESGFGIVAVYDRSGIITALWPEGPGNILGFDYAWRDYFRGACEAGKGRGPGAYVARAFQSENDGDYNLSISTPILESGECVGLVLASILTDSSLGPVRLVGRDNPRHKGVLIGPQDRRRRDPVGVLPRDYLLLLHDALQPAQGASLSGQTALVALEERFGAPRPRGQQLELPDVAPLAVEAYRDPLDAEHRWLAAFYPVGGTGLVVGVQTQDDLTDRIRTAAFWIFAVVAVAVLLSAGGLWLLLWTARSSIAVRTPDEEHAR